MPLGVRDKLLDMDEKPKTEYFEPNVDERVNAAQAKAQSILAGEVGTEEDFMLAMIVIIDRVRNKGLFDDYYKLRTLDELVFEAEIVQGKVLVGAEAGKRTIERASTDAKAELGDWIEKELTGGVTGDSKFMQEAAEFMKTGEFKETP